MGTATRLRPSRYRQQPQKPSESHFGIESVAMTCQYCQTAGVKAQILDVFENKVNAKYSETSASMVIFWASGDRPKKMENSWSCQPGNGR